MSLYQKALIFGLKRTHFVSRICIAVWVFAVLDDMYCCSPYQYKLSYIDSMMNTIANKALLLAQLLATCFVSVWITQ